MNWLWQKAHTRWCWRIHPLQRNQPWRSITHLPTSKWPRRTRMAIHSYHVKKLVNFFPSPLQILVLCSERCSGNFQHNAHYTYQNQNYNTAWTFISRKSSLPMPFPNVQCHIYQTRTGTRGRHKNKWKPRSLKCIVVGTETPVLPSSLKTKPNLC